jgi:Tol biopolymer transport system component
MRLSFTPFKSFWRVKMKFWRYAIFAVILLSCSTQFIYGFGKNKVQYKTFKWRYIQSKNFDIYFYEGGKEIAEFTAVAAESAYVQLRQDFRYDIKDRIVWIVYNSHHDFRQTNVIDPYYDEFTKGVTELYKNRITLPFEGDYDLFRHVIHHELVHAVMNDMLYDGSVQSLLAGEVTQPPLWVSEGLAEFQAVGWDTDLDMVVRDAVLNNYIPDLQTLQYVMPYQGGSSVFKYLADTYGRGKVGEILQKSKGKFSFDRVIQSTLGIGYDELTRRWHRYLRRQYWPEVIDKKDPSEIAKQLTNHTRAGNFLNSVPAITPGGDKIAFVSDKGGYTNIYLMSSADGRILKTLIKGDRSENLEEIHVLRPGMSFSPDGRKLVFAAKNGPRDAISIVDIKSGDIKQRTLDLDGTYTTSWSPDGDKIAFVGHKHNQSDIYILNLRSEEVTQITTDVFTDAHPSWSPDAKKILFVSDRGGYLNNSQLPENFRMSEYDYEQRDIYLVDIDTRELERISDTPWQETNALMSPDGETIAYTSDKNGVFNLYLYKLETGEAYPVTNVISGIYNINWDRNANKLVFSSFFRAGYDIFMIYNPLELPEVELTDTYFVEEMKGETLPVYARDWKPAKDNLTPAKTAKIKGSTPLDFSDHIFNSPRTIEQEKNRKPVSLAENSYRDENGDFKVRKYKLKFSPDIVTGTAGYDIFFGFSGYTAFAFSDLLGDHKIYLNINLVSDLKNSGLSLTYMNLKRRINWGVGGYHQAWSFQNVGNDVQRYRNFGLNFLLSYPFSKFNRLDFNLNWYNVHLEYLTQPFPDEQVTTLLPSLSYVHDSVLRGYTGPIDGSRYAISFLASPKYTEESIDFKSVSFDYRKYFKLSMDYNFAFRLSGGGSFGDNPERFFLGGIDNWINYKSSDGGLRTNNINDIFFSRFITPLRGAYFYESEGNRYLLSNFEFRFPLIQFLGLGIPPLRLFNIRGAMFYDIGTAYFGDGNRLFSSAWRGTHINDQGQREFKNIVSGYGFGARIFFLYFLMRIDVAWRYDLDGSSKPIWYFSLGGDL